MYRCDCEMSNGYKPGWGLEVLPYFRKKMGNSATSVERHVEQAKKTGACNLQGMNLNKFPEELKSVAGTLRTLDLSNNRLRTLPSDLSLFKNLKSLNMSGNRLTVLPEQLTQCSKLESLQVDNNNLASLPPSLSNLKNLKSVSFTQNQLESFPNSLCHLGKLEFLDLSGNKITALPEDIGEISAVEINLNANQVAILPPSVAAAKQLKVLRVQENVLSLEGIPKEILVQSNISLLSVDGNMFTNREFTDLPGYEEYMKRYSASRKKAN